MYKGKDFLFFHAVINIDEKSEIIAKYLKHPKTEPEYRKKRNHAEFITSLSAQEYNIDLEKFILDIKNSTIN
jgi:predicted restriction endonuclease